MACLTCRSSISGTICGCGDSHCQPFRATPSCFQCPPKPQPPPCGVRELDDGTTIPVFHPIHPLIPSIRAGYGDYLDFYGYGCDSEDVDLAIRNDKELAKRFQQAECLLTTCQYPGDSYLLALQYWVLAKIELIALMQAWQAGLSAVAATGKQPNYTSAPRLKDTEHGAMLEDLEKQGRLFVVMGM